MFPKDWILSLTGGALIGVSASVRLLFNGRVTGISGIVNGALTPRTGDRAWRWFFILGLILGGALMNFFNPEAFSGRLPTATWTVVLAGLFVGFGTVMSGGCTSGHGVCGISRLSPRSMVATIVFMAAGVLIVSALRAFGIYQ